MDREQKIEEEKKLRCPFDKDLACESCLLFIPYEGGLGQRACSFIITAGK